MRESRAACASIRRTVNGHTEWLTQWNSHWEAFNLVGGHKGEDESFEECLIREIGEELGLTEGQDFHIDEVTPAEADYTAWSKRANQRTQYRMRVFHVGLEPSAIDFVSADPRNCWLTQAEIVRGLTHDQRPVSETVARLLGVIGDLRPLLPPGPSRRP